MKNFHHPTQHHVLVDPALIQAHSSVYRAMADIRLAAKIIRERHNRRQEPNRAEEHSRLDQLLQEMLRDVQQMIGCDSLRQIDKSCRHE